MRLVVLGLTIFASCLLCYNSDKSYSLSHSEIGYDSKGNSSKVIETYDSQKKKVYMVFNKPPRRVVTNQEGVLETLLALNVGNSIVAASISNRYMQPIPDSLLNGQRLPPILRHEFDRETILMTNPDFIVGWRSTFSYGALGSTDFWNSRGIPTYIVASSNRIKTDATIDDECNFIMDMGRIFSKKELSKEIVSRIYSRLSHYQLLTSKINHHPRVMVLQYNSPANIFAYEKSWLIGNIISCLGGQLVAGENHTISKEEIIRQNPEIIFVMCTGQIDSSLYESYVKNDLSLNSIDAVKNNRIYAIPFSYVYAPGVNLEKGLSLIFDDMYPNMT